MATRTWIGGATAVAQVDDFEITGVGGGSETWTFTITDENGGTRTVTFTDDGTPTAAEIVAGLVAAWNADTYAASLATASDSNPSVVLTAATAGVPFYASLAASGTGTVSKSTTTANKGPNDWNTKVNWAQGAVPVASDDVVITGSNAIKYGLDQSSVALSDFEVAAGCTAQIGTASFKLKIDPDSFTFNGTGTSYIDIGTAAISPVILNTATATSGVAGLYLTGSAIATLDLRKGNVRLEGSTVTTVLQSYLSNRTSDTTLSIPGGNTVTTVHVIGGTCTLSVAATTVNADGGTLTTQGSGAITTMNVTDGTVYSNSSGTISTLNADGGTVDFSRSRTARTVTTLNRRGSATVIYDDAYLTITNAIAGSGPHKLTAA